MWGLVWSFILGHLQVQGAFEEDGTGASPAHGHELFT